jgi:signal transduction histidine kinase
MGAGGSDYIGNTTLRRLRISPFSIPEKRSPNPLRNQPNPWVLVLGIAFLILAWLALELVFDSLRFVVVDPRAKTGFEMLLAVGQLFAALVLFLVPLGEMANRMRWVAMGFLVLAIGALNLGFLYPVLTDSPRLSPLLYGSLYTRAVGISLMAIGLLPAIAPRLSRDRALALLSAIALAGTLLVSTADHLPPLVQFATSNPSDLSSAHTPTQTAPATVADLENILDDAAAIFPGLTVWHWLLSAIPLSAALAATLGAGRLVSHRAMSAWILGAILLLAGTQLNSLFWPSLYSSILTTTSLLRLAMVVAIVTGGIMELQRIMDERAELIAREQERIRQLEELSLLKADFSAMVAHELASPLAAIATMGEMTATGELPSNGAREIGRQITAEARFLQSLVTDVRSAAEVERDDFQIRPRPFVVALLLAEVRTYAQTLPPTHELTIESTIDADVVADSARIGQVLRNLLANAVRHTPPGTRMTLSVEECGERVRIAVSDEGPGISIEEQARIFEKFERGSAATERKAAGFGLGLYLSRRILQAHGSDLLLESAPGRGTTFWFTLEKAP